MLYIRNQLLSVSEIAIVIYHPREAERYIKSFSTYINVRSSIRITALPFSNRLYKRIDAIVHFSFAIYIYEEREKIARSY